MPDEVKAKRVKDIEEEEQGAGNKKNGKPNKKGAADDNEDEDPREARRKRDADEDAAPAAKPDKKAQKTKEAKSSGEGSPKKKKRPALGMFIGVNLFWIIAILGVLATCRLAEYGEDGSIKYLLDPEGIIRGPVLYFLNPEEMSREDYYKAEIQDVYDMQQSITESQEEIDKTTEELELRDTELTDRESALEENEATVEAWLEKINEFGAQGSADSNDINTMAKIMSEMSPSKAAILLEEYGNELNILALLKKMNTKKAAAILDSFSDTSISTALLQQLFPDLSDLDPLPSQSP